MPVRFPCNDCGQMLGIGTRKIGAEIQCPRCGKPLIVPDEVLAEKLCQQRRPQPTANSPASWDTPPEISLPRERIQAFESDDVEQILQALDNLASPVAPQPRQQIPPPPPPATPPTPPRSPGSRPSQTSQPTVQPRPTIAGHSPEAKPRNGHKAPLNSSNAKTVQARIVKTSAPPSVPRSVSPPSSPASLTPLPSLDEDSLLDADMSDAVVVDNPVLQQQVPSVERLLNGEATMVTGLTNKSRENLAPPTPPASKTATSVGNSAFPASAVEHQHGIASIAVPPAAVAVSSPTTPDVPDDLPGGIWITHRTLYTQIALLLGLSCATYFLGWLIGARGTMQAESIQQAQRQQPAQLSVTITYKDDQKRNTKDAGALVLIWPVDSQPLNPLDLEGFRPQDADLPVDAPARTIIQQMGGIVARSDAGGTVTGVTLPKSGDFFVLIVSAHARRPPGEKIKDNELAILGRLFADKAPDVLGEAAYRFTKKQLSGPQVLHQAF
ncbi:MAG: hypothetical protein SFX18_13585 [Pirellulales bacterium]|nr:hypothetical protein [Pirellulales bacterium]